MATKRKFKRDYIILESKDMNFRYKERVLPKAFAKVEINEEKATVALYVENLKFVKEGYRVVVIQSDYETLDLGNILLSEQGKGEFVFNLENSDIDIKGVALLYDKVVPLIGFKGTKIDNYEEILFAGEEIDDDEEYEYEEIEYIEIDEDSDEEYEYEEIEYIEVDDDDEDEYEETEYIEVDDDDEYEDSYNEDNYDEEYSRVKTPQTYKEEYNYRVEPEVSEYVKTNTSTKTNDYTSINEEAKAPNMLLMPRQIKKGLKVFKEVKPFQGDYIENTRWWKIEINPMTMCGYTMPHLGYINTLNYTMYSDTVMQSYKYRHYLFGVQYDEYSRRKNYIYAIPGKKDEQPDKGHTGFIKYQPCDTRNDNLGYWICLIDTRSRKILK